MSMDPTVWGDLLTDTSTDAKAHKLGTRRVEYHATYGRQEWRWVLNGEASSSLTAGLGVMIKAATALYTGVISGAAAERTRMLGVAQSTIAAGSYGWIQTKGWATLKSDGSTTASTAQKAAAAGLFTDGVVGSDELLAWASATEDPAGSGGTFLAYIDL